MTWALTDDVRAYLAAAGRFLASQPVQHTIQLSVAAALTESAAGHPPPGRQPALFGSWQAGDEGVTAAVLHTPPFPVLLTDMPAHATAALADALLGLGREPVGVTGNQAAATAFAAAWCDLTGSAATEYRRSRLYRLGRLGPPDPVPPGRPRVAGAADLAMLETWLRDFAAEVDDIAGYQPGVAADRISFGGLTVWEVAGQPVAMGGCNRPGAGVVRISPIYTLPDQRGRGYGGAVTAAVSRAALAGGADDVVLFTDLANPVSNALYQRLGYQPVEDRVVLRFGSAPGAPDPARR
jgi:ribosomal protein S18 acetylase RimI-like enzyme